ncbi:MAG: threonine--tRNA ligase [Patescibacteria group bacterium]
MENKQEKNIEMMRHSCAHLVAAAVKELYPIAKFGVGPTVENGFYYDIDFGKDSINEEDLKKIEEKAKELQKQNVLFERMELPIDEAIKFFQSEKQDYKVELLKDLKEKGTTKINSEKELADTFGNDIKNVSLYKTLNFTDLCRGPHVEKAKEVGFFKLTKLAGAYWRGDEKNSQLTRIYGVCFETKEKLNEYFEFLKEAEKRDHRKLLQSMDLCHFEPEYAPGAVFWHPAGWIVYRSLINFMREKQEKSGYIEVETPRLMDRVLWESSGHWEKYGEHNYSGKTEDERQFCVKPMNCPGNILVYKNGLKSYKDLPIKMSEFGKVNRYEASGVLHGLLRVREFTQDDAHIFCTPEQIEEESVKVVKFILDTYKELGFEKVRIKLSTRPEKRIGSEEVWDKSEKALADALIHNNYEFEISKGEGAFYGPKLEFVLRDAIGRDWQMGTLQVDMNLPERFDISYIGEDGEKHRPVMLHRAILGSIERFMGIMLEHYIGNLPVWLAPIQIKVIPVSEKHIDFANKLVAEFKELGIRSESDDADETVGKKIKKATAQKPPYMVVVGDNEIAGEDWTVRIRGEEEQLKISKEKFLEKIKKEIEERK